MKVQLGKSVPKTTVGFWTIMIADILMCLWYAPLIKGPIGLIAGVSVSSPPISGFPLLQTATLTKVIHTIREQCGNRKGWVSWPNVGQFRRAILALELAMDLATAVMTNVSQLNLSLFPFLLPPLPFHVCGSQVIP